MYKLMHIEDDTELSALIQENLERYGYTVVQLKDFFDIDENGLLSQLRAKVIFSTIRHCYFNNNLIEYRTT
ncbi:hypothetical protein [Lysinibacillus sp. NPDC086135]|uniref:hypothetical protein n=1 Tax=Lysinibacillus sp. NPDC086135 TaxID=3364130 RepID=UPI0037F85F16